MPFAHSNPREVGLSHGEVEHLVCGKIGGFVDLSQHV